MGLKLKVVLKEKDTQYIENIRLVLLMAGLGMEGILNEEVL